MGVSALFQSPVSSCPLFEISSIGYHLALLLFLKFSTAKNPLTAFWAAALRQTAPSPYFLVHQRTMTPPPFSFARA